jgi:SAM-dependent methyltransferase
MLSAIHVGVVRNSAFFHRFYPDDSKDGTLAFYNWVRQHIGSTTMLLDLGCGPGANDSRRNLRGAVAEVVGADIDPTCAGNPDLDRFVLLDRMPWPLESCSFDIIVCDYCLEHVSDPGAFLGEAWRVLKPGASMFFRTPNLYHYVAAISRLLPNRLHGIANRVRGLQADAHDPWPTFYRLNTPGAIRHHAIRAGFTEPELRMIEPEPSYLAFSRLSFLLGVGYERCVNAAPQLALLRANMLGRLVRPQMSAA